MRIMSIDIKTLLTQWSKGLMQITIGFLMTTIEYLTKDFDVIIQDTIEDFLSEKFDRILLEWLMLSFSKEWQMGFASSITPI